MQKLASSFRTAPRAERAGDVDDNQTVELTIVLRPSHPVRLEPGVPHLTHADYEQRHGTSSAILDQVAALAREHGLTIVETSAARHAVKLSATYAQARAAFQPDGLGVYKEHGRSFVARHGHLSVPDALASEIVAVMGLDQRPVFKPRSRFLPRAQAASWNPTEIARHYQFPEGVDGTGQAIAILELGGGYDPNDVASYFEATGVKRTGKLVSVSVGGASNTPGDEADGEVQLDIDVAGAVAPGADLVVYFGLNQSAGFLDVVQAAIDDDTNKPSIVTLSWGAPESVFPAQDMQAIDQAIARGAALGISFFVASGDSGASDGVDDGALHVDFPASSPNATGCGGTSLPHSGTETAWNNGAGGGASGGGFSTVFDKPSWQSAISGTKRGVPDVAGDADPATGYNVQVDGQDTVAGGTSAVAPLWAGLTALLNQSLGKRAGFLNPTLYANASTLTDITSGDNAGYSAGPGWDPVTGLGSPIGTAILAALKAAPAASRDTTKTGVDTMANDVPFFDPVAYGNGPADSVTDTTEAAAVAHHQVTVGGRAITYTSTAGHLVTVDPQTSKPDAKIFYVAFTEDGAEKTTRPVTFFYNGGPGSSSVYVLLGSFGPRRIKTSLPDFTPPAPYTIEDNPDSLLDRSDLIFINPVGTGYSAAVAPHVNKDFWGVDQDAGSLKQFIKRYLTANDRWNSPKFLFGESYGTPRTCVLAYLLHEDGVDLNGLTLQSSILDYSQAGNPVGLMPTYACDAWYHKRSKVEPLPATIDAIATQAVAFSEGPYAAALAAFPKEDATTVQRLSAFLGIDQQVLISWSLNVAAANAVGNSAFLTTVLADQGLALGSYDGRATAVGTGIAATINPMSGGNDPTMTAVNGVYTAMWNTYLNDELKFTSNSSFTDLNDLAFANWDFHHTDPTGAQKGVDAQGNVVLYTAGDLAAVMSLNVDLKVLSANGYYDSVTPFHQTERDLAGMPLIDKTVRKNLTIRFFPSGHMIYLDGGSRTALKADLAAMYDSTTADHKALARVRALQVRRAERLA